MKTIESHRARVNAKMKHHSTKEIRWASWKQCEEELVAAETANRPVSSWEMAMGRRKEELEPEVREAVELMNAKGYTTYYSGYEGNDGLHVVNFVASIAFFEDLSTIMEEISEETGIYTWWNGQDVLPPYDDLSVEFGVIDPLQPLHIGGIAFIDTRGDRKVLQRHWNHIAEALPQLTCHSLPRLTGWAETFRFTHILVVNTLI